VKTELR